jgi:hypothetical protein
MQRREIEELIKNNDHYVYQLHGDGSWRDFEHFQEILCHYTDWPIAGGLGLKKNFELHIDREIFIPVTIYPSAWSVIKLIDEEQKDDAANSPNDLGKETSEGLAR